VARRQELLDRVTDDLAANGLADFSLRRAARAAGTTHKVLLYYFDGPQDLLAQAVYRLRDRRLLPALAATASEGVPQTLADRVRAAAQVVLGEEAGLRRVLDQAMGLAMYDTARYGALGREATQQYLPGLIALCPAGWSGERKREVAEMILATLRGFTTEQLFADSTEGIAAGLEALVRALEREEAAG
jgi:AcrR family transcriptional regulator